MAAPKQRFDPHAVLAALERNYVDYVLIGGLAQVVRGVDHFTAGVDICPSFVPSNLERLTRAADELDARGVDDRAVTLTDEVLGNEPVISLVTPAGPLQIVGSPEGSPNGYVDLRRAATKEHLGHGVQPLVASVGDLARLAAALHRDQDVARLTQLRRIMELEVDRTQTLSPPTERARQAARTPARPGRRLTQ